VTRSRPARGAIEPASALPIAFLGMLVLGVVAVATHPPVRTGIVLVLTCLLVAAVSALAEVAASLPIALIGCFTVAGFARAPIGDLKSTPLWHLGVVLAATAAGAVFGRLGRVRPGGDSASRTAAVTVTLGRVRRSIGHSARRSLTAGISTRRRLGALALAAVVLPALTAAMVAAQGSLALVDELLFYFLAVVLVTLVGGL